MPQNLPGLAYHCPQKWLYIALISLYLSLFSPAHANNWQAPDYIEKAFFEIALKNEFQTTDLRILKWHRPIRYEFIYHKMPANNQLIENLSHSHLRHISQITGVNIKQSQKANLRLIMTKDEYYAEALQRYFPSQATNLARESHCSASFQTLDHQIHSAVVIIPVDHAASRGLLPACIVEEITQIMGLPNDSDWVNPSIANDASKLDLLTGLDYLFLKILYNPQLKAGMSLKQSEPIVKQIIRRLNKTGTVKNANWLVKKGGLNRLLD